MSSGGSNYSTGTTGGGNQVSVDTPASNPNSFTKTSAPGGKGGFPSAQSPYAQQQPQMYMPPQQPSMYQQAFPQQYSGYNNYRNAYARPYSPQTPIGAPRPMDEMRYAPGGLEQAPGQLMSDSWGRRPGDFQPVEYGRPTNQMPQYGGPGPTPPMEQMSYAGGTRPGSFFDRVSRGLEPPPVAATQGVVPENMYNPAYQQQMAASNMTDYQRLMQRQKAAGQPQPNYGGGLSGLNEMLNRAPSDLEIANSLGYKGAGSAGYLTDMRARMPHEYEAERAANDAKAKEYLNSIGYGQSGFDASKYEVKKQQPTLTGGSPFSGLGSLLRGV